MHSRIAAVVLGAALVGTLAACTPASTPSESAEPTTSASASPSESPSESPDASPEPSATAAPPAGTPVDEDCLDLVSLDTMYGFDPNFAYNSSFTPASGSLAATAVAEGGVACGWVRETGGGEIVISVSRPAGDELDARRAAAGSDRSFALDGQTGVVQIFDGGVWITATSEYFASAADAQPLTDSVIAAL